MRLPSPAGCARDMWTAIFVPPLLVLAPGWVGVIHAGKAFTHA